MNKICNMSIQDYQKLKSSGMFWELYPEATGVFSTDREYSAQGKFKIENDR